MARSETHGQAKHLAQSQRGKRPETKRPETSESGSAGQTSLGQRVWEALDERLALSALRYEVPAHANTLPYTLGGITLMGLLLLVVSGIVLAQYYNPDPEAANQSVRYVMTGVFLGPVWRGIHFWSAQIVMVTALLHMARIFFSGSFKRPREGNWLVGVGLFGILFGFYFSGTVLKWDQEAIEALEHNGAVADMLGLLGAWFSPAFVESVPILTRLYVAHISILPLILLAFLGVHLALIKALKISPLPRETAPGALQEDLGHKGHTFSRHLKGIFGYGYIVAGLVLLLAVLKPPAIGPLPVAGIEVTKPPWLFLPMFQLENWWGVPGLFWATVAVFVLLAAVPFLDWGRDARWVSRKVSVFAGGALALLLIGLGLAAYLAPPVAHIGM